jgi:hypothetical protein
MSPIALGSDLTNISGEASTDRSTAGAALVLHSLEAVQEELRQLRGLPHGWEGGRAPSIPDSTIDFAFDVFAALLRPGDALPAVVPTVKGGIQFEWHTAEFHVEIAVLRSAKIDIYTVNRETGDDDMTTAAAPAEVRAILDGTGVHLA